MNQFKTGQAWRERRGNIVEITVREDGKIWSPGCNVILESDGRFYRTNQMQSPFDLMEKVMRVYIAGPIGNAPDRNRPAFDAAAAEWRGRGCFVINPLDLVPEGTEQGECMRIDIAALLTCDMVVMLPGWSKSKGARAEHVVAVACRMAIGCPAGECEA